MIHAGPPLEEEAGLGSLTLGGFLEEVAARSPSRPAIVFEGRTTTYAELREQARTIARALLANDVVPGTRVAVLMGNRPEWVASAFAVAMTGAVLVPVNTFYEPPELEYVLDHSGAELLLAQTSLAGHDYVAMTGAVEMARVRDVVWLDTESWRTFLDAGRGVPDDVLDARIAAVDPGDDALVLYTSGTTARPKGVLHVHRAATIQSWRFARQLALDETDRVWSSYPYFWAAGICMVLGATLAAGGCLVMQERFEPGDALRLIDSERATTVFAWPHQLAELEDHADWKAHDFSSIRRGDSVSPFTRHPSVHDLPDWSPRSAFGTSETFTIISSTPANEPPEVREGHHGDILPGNIVRIVDDEITVKGPTLMRGYYGTDLDSCFDDDGFFHTGDAGYVDEQNRLHWTGRRTDMIKTGGANVSPVEVETELLYYPLLKAAVVVGVPHETLGEMVVLAAVAHEGAVVDEAAVREFLRGRVASYKIPRRVVFFDETDIELTGNAKIKTGELRDLVAKRLL